MRKIFLLIATLALGCGEPIPRVALTDTWPGNLDRSYDEVTSDWTRANHLRGVYQEELTVVATFKSPEWRFAHAERLAKNRGLIGLARTHHMDQAKADAAGPYEFELMVTTWDRRENDLDRGKKSIWHVALLDESGAEIEPLEIVKDKRPAVVVRAEFPSFGEFATPYIVKFARGDTALLGPAIKALRMRMSSERGGVEVRWESPAK